MATSQSIPWSPPSNWTRLCAVDLHTEGEPLRVLISGLEPIPGRSMLEKRRYAQAHLDGLRRLLILEPRGHADMYGAIITEPTSPDSDLGVLFLHNQGWSTMCGHGLIALVTCLLETGLSPSTYPGLDPEYLRAKGELRLDTPAGQVLARPTWAPDGRRVTRVTFRNVASFTYALDETVEVPGLGRVRYDLAFGGAFYAYAEAAEVGLDLEAGAYRGLIEAGTAIKQAVMAAVEIRHPIEPDLGFLYGVILGGPAQNPAHQGPQRVYLRPG